MVGTELNLVLLVLSVLLLAIGAWQDLKTREIADWIWLGMIGAGILLHGLILLIRMVLGEEVIGYFTPWVINIIFAFILAIFLTILGLGGEADRIAFIAIAVITPISRPILVFSNPMYELLLSFVPRIFGVFCNAYLITLPIPFLLFLYNILNQFRYPDFYDFSYESSIWRRLSIRFIGYPYSTQFLANDFEKKPWHYDFLEEFDEETGWRMVFRARLDTPEADLARKQKAISTINLKKKDSIWVQPNLPFIFILMFAYLLEIIWGNLLLFWMSFLF
jgi:hypothetical protein